MVELINEGKKESQYRVTETGKGEAGTWERELIPTGHEREVYSEAKISE